MSQLTFNSPIEDITDIIDSENSGLSAEQRLKEIKKIVKMGSEYKGNLVDESWLCSCGALNAAYNKECGKCNTIKPTGKWGQITKTVK
jgi:hypothetical protein|tara:strand:+ start:153 stop:416 length:264 start_codon:yes stop_codon:yes gene_type:complete